MVRPKTRRTLKRVAARVALEFVARINRADAAGLSSLVSEDHVFVDARGARIRGRRAIHDAWVQYFQLVPEYRIRIQGMIADDPTVVLLGSASGGYVPPGHSVSLGRWRTPAAWRALVRRGLIAQWQVYADNEPIRELVRKGPEGRPTKG